MARMIFDSFILAIKGIAKMALQSRMSGRLKPQALQGERIIIMGNGPSLNDAIAHYGKELEKGPAMAVNFAANTPVFQQLRPEFYVMVDPHFFNGLASDANVRDLYRNLEAVSWPMSLIVPARWDVQLDNPNVRVLAINDVGVAGPRWLSDFALRYRWGMPRPRNVLIAAISAAIQLGFRQIDLVGADHSWLRTLDVDDQNRVVSVQPHFYADPASEKERQATVYSNVTLPQILESFQVAFAAYHQLQRYAVDHGIIIRNRTPRSMIDAFPRV